MSRGFEEHVLLRIEEADAFCWLGEEAMWVGAMVSRREEGSHERQGGGEGELRGGYGGRKE